MAATPRVTPPGEGTEAVPQNGGYMVAAYLAAAVILVGYAVVLARRKPGP